MAEKIYCLCCDSGDPHYEPGICKTCRADRELGRLVRGMGLSSTLTREGPKLWNYFENKSDDEHIDREGDTPEEALSHAPKTKFVKMASLKKCIR